MWEGGVPAALPFLDPEMEMPQQWWLGPTNLPMATEALPLSQPLPWHYHPSPRTHHPVQHQRSRHSATTIGHPIATIASQHRSRHRMSFPPLLPLHHPGQYGRHPWTFHYQPPSGYSYCFSPQHPCALEGQGSQGANATTTSLGHHPNDSVPS